MLLSCQFECLFQERSRRFTSTKMMVKRSEIMHADSILRVILTHNRFSSREQRFCFFVLTELPVLFAQVSANHLPGGSNVLYMDGHVSYVKFGAGVPLLTDFGPIGDPYPASAWLPFETGVNLSAG